ncbi:MAG TPA: hypothetical protein PKB09_03370 [Candidatus Saccharibacteria bacterium]|nr:hypothetical protein [Candidatus Saccharibacteria bacterium]
MTATKDTIYIDIDDEITAIVDKLQASDSNIVALVLPKRATVLQSIINMKLLKRASDEAGKKAVLITSEVGLLPLAGATGMYVAKNLQSKPEIPDAPDGPTSDEDEEITDMANEDPDNNVGKLAGAAAIGASTGAMASNKASAATASPDKAVKKAKKPKSGTTKIPNFDKFRKKTFIIIGAVLLLIVAWYFAVFVMPTATIVVETENENLASAFEFTADTTSSSVDVGDKTVPAELATVDKQDSQSAPATGTKDVGTRAKGTVTIRNCTDAPVTIKSGTGVSSNNKTFIMQSALALGSGNFDSGSNCKSSGSHVGAVQVVAEANGDDYNLGSGSSYSVAGLNSSVTGTGTAMSGGSSKTIKVVSQSDVDAAKAKLNTKDDSVKDDLTKSLEEKGYFAIVSTYNKKNEKTTTSPEVGQEGSEVTVSYSATFTMLGVKKEDLRKVIEDNVKEQVDTDKQSIQNDGIDSATYEVLSDTNGDNITISYDGQVEVGPDINIDELKSLVAGQKKGDTENIVSELPSVTGVTVKYSPFWVNKTPKNTAKIKIEFSSAQQE